MTFDEYLSRYQLLEHAVERDEKNLTMLKRSAYLIFSERYGACSDKVLRSCAEEAETLEKRIRRRKRICERYAIRLSHGIAAMEPGECKEYARYHFLYGMSNEAFAEISHYSVRTVYRFSREAKKELFRCLLTLSPKVRKIPPARFTVTEGYLRTKKSLAEESRRVAALRSKQKGKPYRKLIYAGLR